MRFAWVIFVASCGHAGPALVCKPGPANDWPRPTTCEEVVDDLATVRRGGSCASRIAEESLVATGTDAAPYLIRAFDDEYLAVAEVAMRASMRIGRDRPVRAWCAGASGDAQLAMCRRALAVREAHRRFSTLDCPPAVRY